MSATGTVTPFDATNVRNQLPNLGNEVGLLSFLASNIASLGAKASQYQDQTFYNFAIGNATLLRRGLQVDVIDALTREYNKGFKEDDYISAITSTTTTYIVLSIIIFIALMLVLLCLLCLATRPTQSPSLAVRLLAQFIIIVQIIFAITVLILGIVLIFAGVYLFYGCEIIDGVINNRDYIRNNLPKFDRDYPAINPGANECVFRNGRGFLINALGSNTTYIDIAYLQLENVLAGQALYTQLNVAN